MRRMDHGNAWSLYFRDPEGNRLEMFCDTQWYIEQPCLEDLDLSLPAEEIRARSDAFCRSARASGRSPNIRPKWRRRSASSSIGGHDLGRARL